MCKYYWLDEQKLFNKLQSKLDAASDIQTGVDYRTIFIDNSETKFLKDKVNKLKLIKRKHVIIQIVSYLMILSPSAILSGLMATSIPQLFLVYFCLFWVNFLSCIGGIVLIESKLESSIKQSLLDALNISTNEAYRDCGYHGYRNI